VAVGAFRAAHLHLVVRGLRILRRRRPVHRLPHHHHHHAAPAAAVHAVAHGGAIVRGPRRVRLLLLGGGGRRAGGDLVALEVAELVEVELERLDVVLEAERGHGPEQVVAVDGLALLALALVGGLAGDERDELGHALLHRLLGVLGDLGVRWERLLHDPAHVRDRQEPVLLPRRRELRVARPAGLVVRVRHRSHPLPPSKETEQQTRTKIAAQRIKRTAAGSHRRETDDVEVSRNLEGRREQRNEEGFEKGAESGSVRRMNRGDDKNASSGRRGAWWAVGLSISLGASQRSPIPSVSTALERIFSGRLP
jgi:hypothetical protein